VDVIIHSDGVRIESHHDYSNVFKESGDFLIEALLKGGDGTHPDRFFFSILYLYRHALEIQLKSIISIGIQLGYGQSDDEKLLGSHKLYPLWDFVKKMITEDSQDKYSETTEVVEETIKTLHELDSDGQKLRYSRSKVGKINEYNIPRTIDFLNTRTVFDGVWHCLVATEDYFMHELENKLDYENMLMSDFGECAGDYYI
jgi:hypothetical protein